MTMVEELVDAGEVTADMFVIGGCAWTTTPTQNTPVGQRCREFRRKLTPLLDRTATEYDAVLTTARLTTLRGNHARQTRGLSAGLANGSPVRECRSWWCATTRRSSTTT